MALVLHPFSLVLFLFLLPCSCCSKFHGDDEGFEIVELSTMKPANVCSEWKAPSRNSLRVTHRFGPCSPSNDGHWNDSQILVNDMLRFDYIQNRLRSTTAKGNTSMDPLQTSLAVELPARHGQFLGVFNYVVTVGIGTPKRDQTVAFDSGSNLCWFQCEPCQSCYRQAEPIYSSTASSTYRSITCNDEACTSLPSSSVERGCTNNNVCTYRTVYMDSSTTKGLLARERMELSTTQTRPIVLPNFVFGCGQSNRGRFGGTAGLLGLGRGFHSLVTQASGTLGNVFSYCLPSMINIPGYLILGRRVAPSPMYTPMLINTRHDDRGFYFVNLVGISVGSQRLQLPETVFQNVGTIIDSGSVFTRLRPAAYRALRDAFRRRLSRYQQAPPYGDLDTCYTVHGTDLSYPPITLHLSGADLQLRVSQMLHPVAPDTFCLAFATSGNETPNIIGNIQQKGMEVIYDMDLRRIGFSRGTNCR